MKNAYIVVDLGFGDSGKGTITDWLTDHHKATLNVRYNGGAQCAHSVVLEDKEHIFNQFGSGTFVPGTKTFFSKHAFFSPLVLTKEIERLARKGVDNPGSLFYVDIDTPVVTPYHRAANRLKEMARKNKHGTCGMGIGETARMLIEVPDIAPTVESFVKSSIYANAYMEEVREHLYRDIQGLRDALDPNDPMVIAELSTFKVTSAEVVDRMRNVFSLIHIIQDDEIHDLFRENETVVFEGAQGVLLDQDYGFQPYTTWSDTTSRNAHQILAELGYSGDSREIGVVRTFTTRHGAGPFPSEDPKLSEVLSDPRNIPNPWQKEMRFGHFDAMALCYALDVNRGVDELAVTHVDWLRKVDEWSMVTSYEMDGKLVPRLAVHKYPDFHMSEARAEKLFNVQLNFSHSYNSKNQNQILGQIAGMLDTDIGLISSGPKRSDKTINPHNHK